MSEEEYQKYLNDDDVIKLGQRQAQYWGGFRYVTSVQRYDFKSVAELKEKLRFIHPLERLGRV